MGGIGRLEGAMRKSARTASLLMLGGALVASLLEFVFRYVLVASTFPSSQQSAEDLIFRFDSSGSTFGVRSHGPLATNRIRWRVNNAGWNCPHDYVPRTSTRPRIALLGDSYIEALYVDMGDHIESHLEHLFDGGVDVYAFGRSNWYLAQYVALSRYIEERFSPDVYVVFLTVDDVWWSLREKGLTSPYLFQISRHERRVCRTSANGRPQTEAPAGAAAPLRSGLLREQQPGSQVDPPAPSRKVLDEGQRDEHDRRAAPTASGRGCAHSAGGDHLYAALAGRGSSWQELRICWYVRLRFSVRGSFRPQTRSRVRGRQGGMPAASELLLFRLVARLRRRLRS